MRDILSEGKCSCYECGICKSVSPFDVKKKYIEMEAFAASLKDETMLEEVSSGGAFLALAEAVIGQGGIVYGVAQKKVGEVYHERACNIEACKQFCRSKYLPSEVENVFPKVKTDLENGKLVLFTGVGCQIIQLYQYLGCDDVNLYTCEMVCHGTPCKSVFKAYLHEMEERKGTKAVSINYRDKREGWRKNHLTISFADGTEESELSLYHVFHRTYLDGLINRSACIHCMAVTNPRKADISLADYWNYSGELPDYNKKMGISVIICSTEKGKNLSGTSHKKMFFEKTDMAEVQKSCYHLTHAPKANPYRNEFLQNVSSKGFFNAYYEIYGKIMQKKEGNTVLRLKEDEITKEKVVSLFWEDFQEIIYIENRISVITGIITFGKFMDQIQFPEKWINRDFQKTFYEENYIAASQKIMDQNQKINVVPVLDKKGELLFELRRPGWEKQTAKKISPLQISIYEKWNQLNMLDMQGMSFRDLPSEIEAQKIYLTSNETQRRILAEYGFSKVISCDEMSDALARYAIHIKILTLLNKKKCKVLFVKRPDCKEAYPYSLSEQKRIKNALSFPVMSQDVLKYKEDWKELLKEKFSEEYISNLMKIPPIYQIESYYRHDDISSAYVNVKSGYRITLEQPDEPDEFIYLYGRCGVFGYAVEDGESLSSQLQKIMNKNKKNICIENRGLWGAGTKEILANLYHDLLSEQIANESRVIVYMDDLTENDVWKSAGAFWADTTQYYHENLKQNGNFYDKPGHMTAEGYAVIAEFIFHILETDLSKIRQVNPIYQSLTEYDTEGDQTEPLKEYLEYVRKTITKKSESEITGAIVMNCNPFTRGHRYLIETASHRVNRLLIFVVEEDRSFFPFSDRIAMVKEGTKDLNNVQVLPSGRFMISTRTFPEYFLKEQNKEITIDPSADIECFAMHIAPKLGISIRFIGTEPIDKVTDQYNQALKRDLQKYNIQCVEIERINIQEGVPISASSVRKAMKDHDRKLLKAMLPDTTLRYLERKGWIEKEETGNA